jgi:hypothetical protein
MRVKTGTPSKRRQQLLLLSGLLLALLITVFFGLRAFRRFSHPPSNEPIREWMSIPYIAHAYHVPPPVLLEALSLPADTPPNRRPINRIAKDLNLTTDEVIQRLEDAIAQDRASRAPPEGKPEKPPPDAPAVETPATPLAK